MTKNEAYEAMQEGYPISHKDFSPNQFLYMDQNFIIRDENGIEWEASWDVADKDTRFGLNWFIYKGTVTKRMGTGRKLIEVASNENLISHIQGKDCPGKQNCLQYVKVAGETACLICDCNEEKAISGEEVLSLYDSQLENDYNNDDYITDPIIKRKKTISKSHALYGLFSSILLILLITAISIFTQINTITAVNAVIICTISFGIIIVILLVFLILLVKGVIE